MTPEKRTVYSSWHSDDTRQFSDRCSVLNFILAIRIIFVGPYFGLATSLHGGGGEWGVKSGKSNSKLVLIDSNSNIQ